APLRRAFTTGQLVFAGSVASLAEPAAFAAWLADLRQHAWVVYAKRPFGGPRQVLDYLGRYTHRVALSNDRLVRHADGVVHFRWKDYADGDRVKVMRSRPTSLSAASSSTSSPTASSASGTSASWPTGPGAPSSPGVAPCLARRTLQPRRRSN